MSDITISQLRHKVTEKLSKAMEEVRKLEEMLSMIDSIAGGDGISRLGESVPLSNPGPPKQSPLEIQGHDDEESVGRAITEMIRSMDGEFSVQTVAKFIKQKFPSLTYAEISKKFAAKAYRLQHRGEIEIVKKGYGRTPHTYRRIIKKGEGKEVLL